MAKKRSKKPPVSRAKTIRWAWIPVLGIGGLALYCYWNAQSNELPVIAGPDYPKRETVANHRQLSHYTVYHRLNRQRTPGLPLDSRTSQKRLLPPEEVPQWSSQWSAESSSGPDSTTTDAAGQPSIGASSKTKGADKGNGKDNAKDPSKDPKGTRDGFSALADSGTGAKAGAHTRDKNGFGQSSVGRNLSKKVNKHDSQAKQSPSQAPRKALATSQDRAPSSVKAAKSSVVQVIGVFPTKKKAMAVYRAWQASSMRHKAPLRPHIQKGVLQGRTLYRVVMMGSAHNSSVSSWMHRLKP